jgi:hypothetical protein
MKALPAVIAFAVGVTLTAVACRVVNSVNESVRQVTLRSEVHHPLRQCLDDIAKTQERGDVAIAQEKLRLLRQRWVEYLDGGGRTPELFVTEIMGPVPAATQAAN